jgi:hypothetical protein
VVGAQARHLGVLCPERVVPVESLEHRPDRDEHVGAPLRGEPLDLEQRGLDGGPAGRTGHEVGGFRAALEAAPRQDRGQPLGGTGQELDEQEALQQPPRPERHARVPRDELGGRHGVVEDKRHQHEVRRVGEAALGQQQHLLPRVVAGHREVEHLVAAGLGGVHPGLELLRKGLLESDLAGEAERVSQHDDAPHTRRLGQRILAVVAHSRGVDPDVHTVAPDDTIRARVQLVEPSRALPIEQRVVHVGFGQQRRPERFALQQPQPQLARQRGHEEAERDEHGALGQPPRGPRGAAGRAGGLRRHAR